MTTTKVTFETGATSHAVNDLILFTDNTRELAELRDEIYQLWVDKKYVMSPYAFEELRREAKKRYKAEFGEENSEHIIYMGKKAQLEYCTLYANDFANWMMEHGI